MIIFNSEMYKSYYYLLCLSIILLPQAFILPIEASYENHSLENLEVIILGLGLFTMVYKIYISNLKIVKYFYMACSLFYTIMIARELSFGRVFYPVGIDDHGEQIFMNIHQLWYGPIVYPVIAILAIGGLLLMVKTYRAVKTDAWHFIVPRYSLVLFVVMLFCSQVIFEKNMITILADYGQLLEECTELIAYFSLVLFTKDIVFEKRWE